MDIGISFPQTEIGADPAAIRDFAQAAEGMGFIHISVLDHVLGAGTPKGPAFAKSYTRDFTVESGDVRQIEVVIQ